MRKANLITAILCAFIALSTHNKLCAQKDSVDALISFLDTLRQAEPFDTALFRKHVDRLQSYNLEPADINSLHEVAQRFDKGTDLDFNLYIRIRVFTNLIRNDVNAAIDYAKGNIQLFEKNTSANSDLLKLFLLSQLRLPFRNSDRLEEGFLLYNDRLRSSIASNDSASTVVCYFVLAGFYRAVGLYDAAIYHMKKSIAFIDSSYHQIPRFLSISIMKGMGAWINNTAVLGQYYNLKGDFETSLVYSRQAYAAGLAYPEEGGNSSYQVKNIAVSLMDMNKLDSADLYLDSATGLLNKMDFGSTAAMMQRKAQLFIKKGELEKAEQILQECWKLIREKKIRALTPSDVIAPDYYLALIRIAQHKLHEAAALLHKDLDRIKGIRLDVLRDYRLLGETYHAMGEHERSNEAFQSFITLQDSLLADQARFRMLSFETEEELSAKEKDILNLQNKNRLTRILWVFSLGIVLLLGILALVIYQRYRVKQKDNRKLEKALTDLKDAQRQLIQSEKMASLGELTAGIAHEIKNPLNFVNNFSELNKELIDEMNDEIASGNWDSAREIAGNIKENEEKIAIHGKRADGIVKSMLLHSATGSGKKESIDLNALVDEYLRLAYHGHRARDKSFNARIETDLDPSVQKVEVIPQDLGRVILNLLNNAFYAVDEKRKSGADNYDPTVKVSSELQNNKVLISVKDNGNGIPEKVRDKIFQPFFTTKPTGQGTGLGLSLSYDIITKGHGGEFKMETKEGDGTVFIIMLPYNKVKS